MERFKKEKIKQIENFCVKPNAITETRNGFQCMWFLRDEITYDEWVTIENALVKYFGGDGVLNISKGALIMFKGKLSHGFYLL